MTRQIVVLVLALIVALTAVTYADAGARKGRVSMGPIIFTKHYDKSSP